MRGPIQNREEPAFPPYLPSTATPTLPFEGFFHKSISLGPIAPMLELPSTRAGDEIPSERRERVIGA